RVHGLDPDAPRARPRGRGAPAPPRHRRWHPRPGVRKSPFCWLVHDSAAEAIGLAALADDLDIRVCVAPYGPPFTSLLTTIQVGYRLCPAIFFCDTFSRLSSPDRAARGWSCLPEVSCHVHPPHATPAAHGGHVPV